MAQITYADKAAINENPNVNAINKIRDEDMNEIKSVVNENATTLDNLVVTTQTTSDTNTYSCNYINGTTLYNDASGSNGTIQLSDSVSNYTYLEIYAKPNVTNYVPIVTKTLITGTTNYIYISFATVDSSAVIYHKARVVEATGTSISTYGERYGQFFYNGASSFSHTNDVYITRVIGYK